MITAAEQQCLQHDVAGNSDEPDTCTRMYTSVAESMLAHLSDSFIMSICASRFDFVGPPLG